MTLPGKPLMKSRRVLLLLIALAAVCGVFTYSCITASEVGMQNTITAAEAQRLVEAYVHEAMTALPPQARLEKQYERISDCSMCEPSLEAKYLCSLTNCMNADTKLAFELTSRRTSIIASPTRPP